MLALLPILVSSALVGQGVQAPPDHTAPGGGGAPTASVSATAEPVRFDDPEFVLGSASAPTTVVEYFSNTCAHCAAFDRDTFPYVLEKYIETGRIRYIMREIPTAPTELSGMGFLIARCAGKEKYLSVVRDTFRNQDALFKSADVRPLLIAIGARGGLSVDQMQACLDDDAAFERLNGRLRAAVAAGVEGTPTFVIDGHMLLPGDRLRGSVYAGGELSPREFDLALKAAQTTHRLRDRASLLGKN